MVQQSGLLGTGDIYKPTSTSRHSRGPFLMEQVAHSTAQRVPSTQPWPSVWWASHTSQVGMDKKQYDMVPSMGVPKNGWFIMEKTIKMDDDWGYPHFRKPPYLNSSTSTMKASDHSKLLQYLQCRSTPRVSGQFLE